MKQRIWYAFLIAGGLMLPCGEARAEVLPADTTKAIDIEEIVVVATPKENQRLRQQALASTSFSRMEMEHRSLRSIKSLSGIVPNLFIPEYGSKLTTSVYVRGIGSRINTPAVGLYVNNIPYIDKSAFDFNYSDIERIDVLRGPQGTLYGRNTMGGLVRVYTRSPFAYQGTELNLSAATYNNYKASVSHYTRLSPQLALSANLFYDHQGGYFKNAYTHRRIDRSDEVGGRLRAIYLWGAHTKFDLNLNYEYLHQGGYPYQYMGMVNEEEHHEDRIGKISYNRDCGYQRNMMNGGLNIEHKAEHFVWNSITGFQYLYDKMDLDQDFTEADIYSMFQQQNSKVLSQELVLKSVSDQRWQWTTGVSAFYQWLHTEAPVTFQQDGLDWMNRMVNSMAQRFMPPVQQGNMTMNFVFSDVINGHDLPIPGSFGTPLLNASLFHQSTYKGLLGIAGLSVTAGLRLDYENMKLDYNTGCDYEHTYSLRGKLMPMNRVMDLVQEQTFGQQLHYEGQLKHDYVQFLPKLALQYDFDRQNNIYATLSKGYRSGGFNIQMFSDILQGGLRAANMKDVADVTIPAVNGVPMIDAATKAKITGILSGMAKSPEVDVKQAVLYKPEYSWNYEVGAHLTLANGRLQTDVAAFLMQNRDQQISRFVKSGLGRITVNAGKSRSIGAEAALRALLTEHLSLHANYGYTRATFTDYAPNEGSNENYNGNYVPFVPKHTFAVGAQYTLNFKRNSWVDHIIFSANYQGAGRIYWTEKNDVSQHLYGTLNGRIAVNKSKTSLSLWVNNALNTDYQTFYFETMGRGFAQQARPVHAGIDVKYRF